MQKVVYLYSLIVVFLLTNCSSPKQFEAGRPRVIVRGDTTSKDSIIVYETEVEGRQRSDFKEMLGAWDVSTMRRQQKAELETLSNVHLELKADSTFMGRGGCNNIRGKFSVKGSSIIFNSVSSTKMACENLDKEGAFLNLLENRISEYTFKGNELLLRDGASNIVFECKRR